MGSHFPVHDYIQIIDQVDSSHLDMTDKPLSDLDGELFTDGNSFVEHRQHKLGMFWFPANRMC